MIYEHLHDPERCLFCGGWGVVILTNEDYNIVHCPGCKHDWKDNHERGNND